ncbi:MAG: hypothetical protein AAGG51_22920 [Cyanobacteria bacterium P01_G01_bin.54]
MADQQATNQQVKIILKIQQQLLRELEKEGDEASMAELNRLTELLQKQANIYQTIGTV